MRLRHCAAAAFGLLTLAPVLTACGSGGDLEVGDRLPARSDDQFASSGTRSTVALPLGRLELSLGDVTTSLDADDTRQLEAIEAPEGTVFLPITWQYDAGTFGDYGDYLSTEVNPIIDLIADGAKYRLPAPEATGEGSTSFYLLVSGSGEDPTLEVDFDGVTQEVDLSTGKREAGRAEPLYDLKARKDRARSCTPDTTFKLDFVRLPDFTCTIGRTARVPYAGDAWAEEGHEWLVLTVRTSMRRYDQIAADLKSGAIYLAGDVSSTFTLGKLKPEAVIEDRDDSACPDSVKGGCQMVYHLVFDVTDEAPKRLTVEQDYDLYLSSVWGGAEGKDTLEFPVTVRTRVR